MNKEEFIKKWLKTFAPKLTPEQYEEYIEDQYIWHTFSWELMDKNDYLEDDDARCAYDAADKTDAMYLLLFEDEPCTKKLPEIFDTAYKIEHSGLTYVDCAEEGTPIYMEFYVVGKDFSWTYIVTHENGMLGPYFVKAK